MYFDFIQYIDCIPNKLDTMLIFNACKNTSIHLQDWYTLNAETYESKEHRFSHPNFVKFNCENIDIISNDATMEADIYSNALHANNGDILFLHYRKQDLHAEIKHLGFKHKMIHTQTFIDHILFMSAKSNSVVKIEALTKPICQIYSYWKTNQLLYW